MVAMGSQPSGSTLHQRSYIYYQDQTRLPAQSATSSPTTMADQSCTSKVTAESAYPSPADDLRHSMAPPSPTSRNEHASIASEAPTLPSIREVLLQPMSPSTSPHIPAESYGTILGSPTPMTMFRNTNGNPYADTLSSASDPQLFPEQPHSAVVLGRQLPLFPPPSRPSVSVSRMTTKITPRQRKRTPTQAPLASPLEPSRNPQASVWAMAMRDPAQWYQDRRDEDEAYWPSTSRTPSGGMEMSRHPSSQGATASTSGKRDLDRRDSATQGLPAKRPRVHRGEISDVNRAGTRSSPRDAPATYLDTVLADVPKKPKPAVKHATASAPTPRKIKQTHDEPDRAYDLYNDFTPDISTLDDAGTNFTANWGGKPLNLDHDPDRALLHEKEVKLATKLALTCARYLYLKRRFFAGRLDFARKSQLYNINAAQQQCKGQDVHGVVGADVNKTSSMWKAFNSVGWLDASHMKPFLNRVA